MITVCHDIEFNGAKSMWFYTGEKYVRHDSKGNIQGQITGENLPDAQELWKARCKAFGAAYPCDSISHPTTGEAIRLKPTEAVFKLYDHWQGVKANADNNDNL